MKSDAEVIAAVTAMRDRWVNNAATNMASPDSDSRATAAIMLLVASKLSEALTR